MLYGFNHFKQTLSYFLLLLFIQKFKFIGLGNM